jgi:hypothetical protein
LGFPHEKAFQLFSFLDQFQKRNQIHLEILDENEDGKYEFESDDSSSEEERDYLVEENSEVEKEPLLENSSMQIVDEIFKKTKEKKRYPNKYYVEEEY